MKLTKSEKEALEIIKYFLSNPIYEHVHLVGVASLLSERKGRKANFYSNIDHRIAERTLKKLWKAGYLERKHGGFYKPTEKWKNLGENHDSHRL